MASKHPYRCDARSVEITCVETVPTVDEDVVVAAVLSLLGATGFVSGLACDCVPEWSVAVAFLAGGMWSARDRYRLRAARRESV